ncbi:MAG: hypothetical protein EGR21_02105 [Faecalibacterium prausnitzii]|nr:hypothetical protein [Faecalibacterium prausnitzii]
MRSAFALRISQGNIIFNFGVQKRLRAFLNPIFTGRVVTANSSCSAAFCESAALRERMQLVFTTLSVKNAFGALRRARQTLYIKRMIPLYLPRA